MNLSQRSQIPYGNVVFIRRVSDDAQVRTDTAGVLILRNVPRDYLVLE